jgi:hypothetical protein
MEDILLCFGSPLWPKKKPNSKRKQVLVKKREGKGKREGTKKRGEKRRGKKHEE